jgi:hypothetical protein
MKHLQRNLIRNFFVISLLLLPSLAWSKPVARVIAVKGNVFLMNESGNSELVVKQQHLEDFSDLLVEDGAEITFTDMYEHIYHLSGGTHVKLLDRVVELRNGYIWLQNAHSTASVQVQTSNAVGEFQKGEFIVSYVPTTSKTSLLVLNGEAKFFNSAEEELQQNVASAQFSFIDPEYENGSPRTPTAIGYDSFHQIVSLFTVKPQTAGVEKFYAVAPEVKKEAQNETAVVKREIASVTTRVELKKTIFIPMKSETSRSVASVAPVVAPDEALSYYKKMQNKKKNVAAPIIVFGSRKVAPVVKTSAPVRKTASYPAQIAPAPVKPQIEDDEFTKSFRRNYQQQPKHSNEVNRLIDELESYSSEYRKKY